MIGEYYFEMYENDCFGDDEYDDSIFTNEICKDYDEKEYENAVVFKKRDLTFSGDATEEDFNKNLQILLTEVVEAGRAIYHDPWEGDGKSAYQEKLALLPKKQQNSLLRKVEKIPLFQRNVKSKIYKRFAITFEQKIINLLHAYIIGKPLRVSRDKKKWTGAGRFAKLKMNYHEFFVIDDILCVLGITEQYIPEDGYKDEEILETRIQLTEYGKNLLLKKSNDIAFFEENNDNYQEVILNDTIEKIIKDKNGKKKKIKISKPVDYNKSDKVLRIIRRIKRFNKIYEEQKLRISCADVQLSADEINKFLIHHINKKIKIFRLVYSLPYYTINNSLLNNKLINFINTSYVQEEVQGKSILQSGSSHQPVAGPNGGIKGNIVINNNNINYLACQTNNKKILINELEFEILDKKVHRVFSRKSQSLHGRFYAYQTQINKQLRMHMFLGNDIKPMARLDFSSMHQILAYHLSKIECDSTSIYVIDGFDKNLIKKIALIAMNVKRSKGKRPYQGALQAIKKNICNGGDISYDHAKAAFYAFIKKHSEIENYICSDFGIKGMYYDSQIMDDCLYELMLKRKPKIIVYPVHDELLCPWDKIKIVKEQMIESYRKVIKSVLVQQEKWNNDEPLPDWMKPSITVN